MAEEVVIEFLSDAAGLNPGIDALVKTGEVGQDAANKIKSAFSNTEKQGTQSFQKLATESKNTGQSFQGLSDSISKIGLALGVAFSAQQVIEFGKASVDAFAKAELAASRLQFTVTKVIGGTTQDVQELLTQSEDLSKTSYFTPRQIQEVQALQAQFGLTKDQVKTLTPEILNLAVAQGVDLTTATDNAVRAIDGTTRGLKTVGADFKATGDHVKDYNSSIGNLAKLNGTATDALNTTSGEIKKQEAELEILQEELGARLAPALIEIKKLALDAGIGLSSLLPQDLAKAIEDRIQGVSSALDAVVAKTPTAILQAASDKFNQQLKDLQNKRDALLSQANGLSTLDKLNGKDQPLIDAATKVEDQINVLLGKQKSINDELQKRNSLSAENIKQASLQVLQAEDISKLNKDELNSEIEDIKKRGDASTFFVKGEIERREKAIDAISEAEKKAADKAEQRRQAASDKLKADANKNQDDAETAGITDETVKLSIERLQKIREAKETFNDSGKQRADEDNLQKDLKNIDIKYAKDIAAAELKEQEEAFKKQQELNKKSADDSLQVELQTIDEQSAAKQEALTAQFLKAGDFSKSAEKKLNDDSFQITLDGLNNKKLLYEDDKAKQEEIQAEIEKATKDHEQKLIDEAKEAEKKKAEIREQIVSASVDGIFSIYQAGLANLLTLNQQQKDEEDKSIDDQLTANQSQFDKRYINAKQFAANEKNLQKQKDAADKLAADKEKQLKHEEDLANQAQKVFNIAIQTAENIVHFPALTALYLALGATEEAFVLATPLPKYHSGRLASLSSMEENAIIRKDETIFNPSQSKDFAPTFSAIYNKKIPAFALNEFVNGFNIREDIFSPEKSKGNSFSIDYTKLAREIAYELKDHKEVRVKGFDKLVSALTNGVDKRRQ